MSSIEGVATAVEELLFQAVVSHTLIMTTSLTVSRVSFSQLFMFKKFTAK